MGGLYRRGVIRDAAGTVLVELDKSAERFPPSLSCTRGAVSRGSSHRLLALSPIRAEN